MVLPLEWMREAKRHPYGLAASADQRSAGLRSQFSGSFACEVRQCPALRARASYRPLHSLSYFTLEGLKQDSHRVSAIFSVILISICLLRRDPAAFFHFQ